MRRAPWILPFVALVACVASDQTTAPPGGTARVAPNPIPVAQASVAELPSRLPLGLPDVEIDRLRDPFGRPHGETIIDHPRQRDAALPDTQVQDLRVRGTVRSGLTGYALLVNDRGESAVVPIGRAVGAEIKDKKGAYDWRVDRVREGEVILRGEAADGASQTFKLKAAQGWKT